MTVLKPLLLILATSGFGVNGQLSPNDVPSSTGHQETKLSFPATSAEGNMITAGIRPLSNKQVKAQKRDSAPNGDSSQATTKYGDPGTQNDKNRDIVSQKSQSSNNYVTLKLASTELSIVFTTFFGSTKGLFYNLWGVRPGQKFLILQDLFFVVYPLSWAFWDFPVTCSIYCVGFGIVLANLVRLTALKSLETSPTNEEP